MLCNSTAKIMKSDISPFFKDQNVFITGGTGYMGKCLIEKLLRTCDVKNIYVLIRQKKSKTPEERFNDIIENEIFTKIRQNKPESFKKIRLITGNTELDHLGISEENLQILTENINIVFHCAANLNMLGKLNEIINANIKSISELIKILEKTKQLKACQIISTAYSNCLQHVIEEKLYDPPIKPEILLDLAIKLPTNIFEQISRSLQGRYPNPYIFSKAVGEGLLLNVKSQLPIGLFRPSVVISAYKEPLPGYIDNIYGPIGLNIACGMGVLRVVHANDQNKLHYAPVDMVVNALLCSTVEVSRLWKLSSNFEIPVYNYSCQNTQFHITWRDHYKYCFNNIVYIPKDAIWKVIFYYISNIYMYNIVSFFLETVPSYVVDSLAKLVGKKPILREVYSKIYKALSVLDFFIENDWEIKNDNIVTLWNKLNNYDKEIFNFDPDSIDMNQYYKDMNYGMKKFVLKEDVSPKALEKDRKRVKLLAVLHYVVVYSFYATIFYFLYVVLFRNIMDT